MKTSTGSIARARRFLVMPHLQSFSSILIRQEKAAADVDTSLIEGETFPQFRRRDGFVNVTTEEVRCKVA